MTAIVSKNPMVKQIADGTASQDLLEMLMEKTLPFTDEEYLESFVFILRNPDLKLKAIDRLREIGDSAKTTYVEKNGANHRVAYFVLIEALGKGNLTIVSKIIRNQMFPMEFLMKTAEKGNEAMLEMLLDNQVKMIAFPEIMDKILENSEASNFIKGKIKEIREYYLENAVIEDIPEEKVLDDVQDMAQLEKEAKKKSGEEVKEEDEELLVEELEQKTLTQLQEINLMSISERIKLALSGTRTQRMILIKDTNKMVSLAVLESPKIGIDEIALLCKNKSLAQELVSRIAGNREWTKNYAIVLELVGNPKTPVKSALGFLKKIHTRDLQILSRNRNVNPVIRNVAIKLLQQKNH